MDYALIAPYLPDLLSGFWITVQLSVITLVLATPIATAIALGRDLGPRPLARALAVLVNVVRLLPALIVLYFVFYGGPQLGLRMKPMTAATIGLVAMGAAYMSEDIRGGFSALDRGQLAACRALGLPFGHALRRVLLPQALPLIVPPYMTRAIIMVKGTSLASMVSVADLTAEATRASSITYQPYVFVLLAGVLYLALSGVLVAFQAWVERHLRLRYRLAR
ncbi:amino acid ABC transporter permease [Alloyangia pacifica]|uniref:amino acid ABC transporter permease n=1 Tax=Alloyangia pacifica TaxID=311180 RepID=UPI001CD4D342|nr:amino acid ABC transporter permease [Alloyangia pacifica]MCA0995031.1 amino acid ABC transporter permease [Alloyangia pacifica]